MESLSLTTTVLGVLSLHEQADSSLYSTLFSLMIYCDFLLGLWGLIPDVNRRKYVRYGMLAASVVTVCLSSKRRI